MALVITATDNASYDSPGIDLSLTGLTGYDQLLVERVDTTGEYPDEPVRGMDRVDTSGDGFAGTDFEAPIGKPVTYRLTGLILAPPSDDDVTSSSVTLNFNQPGDAWLKSVFIPSISRRVNVVDFSEWSRERRILTKAHVLGRRNPVIIKDVLGGKEGSMELTVLNIGGTPLNSTQADLEILLEEGDTYLFQTTGSEDSGLKDFYLEIETVSIKRVGIVGGDFGLVYALTWTEVDRPTTSQESLGLRDWDDVNDENVDWQAVADEYSSWLDLLIRPPV